MFNSFWRIVFNRIKRYPILTIKMLLNSTIYTLGEYTVKPYYMGNAQIARIMNTQTPQLEYVCYFFTTQSIGGLQVWRKIANAYIKSMEDLLEESLANLQSQESK